MVEGLRDAENLEFNILFGYGDLSPQCLNNLVNNSLLVI